MGAARRLPASANGSAITPAVETPPGTASSSAVDSRKSRIGKRKSKKKEHTLASDCVSTASSSNCSCAAPYFRKGFKVRVGSLTASRKSISHGDVDALGLPLGMSIAAVVSQVLERKNAAGEKMSVDHLSEICIMAVRESLGNVFRDKFDNFVMNFERSFRSTLTTLRLINDTSQNIGEQLLRDEFRGHSFSMESDFLSHDKLHNSTDGSELFPPGNRTEQRQRDRCEDCSFEGVNKLLPVDTTEDSTLPNGDGDGFDQLPHGISTDGLSYTHEQMMENVGTNFRNQPLVLPDKQQQVACVSVSRSLSTSGINQSSVLSTVEKSVAEQTRANDLKTFEIGLIIKKMELKEKQLALNSHANLLEKMKLSMGFSKASFKAERFKTQLQDSQQVELLRKCLDFLSAGLIIMLLCIAYGTYVYSYRRIIEATVACSPYTESNKSWWMPKSMATINSGLQLVFCQIQVFSRMLFGALMIGSIAFLFIQRSATSHQTMPLTFILLLLGVICGCAGKFCIDTLGGSGNHWLIYWEALCLLHFFANTFYSNLFFILNGPIVVAERMEHNTAFPYWIRRFLFFALMLVLPLLCGFMPFASPREWYNHFTSMASDFMMIIED